MRKGRRLVTGYLYTAFTEDAAACFECKKILDEAGVKYSLLHYGDESQHQQNFDALGTWSFGPEFNTYTFKKFPIVVWQEFYDDYERFHQVAQSADELRASNLLKNASLVADKK
jgi:hypothetical protein